MQGKDKNREHLDELGDVLNAWRFLKSNSSQFFYSLLPGIALGLLAYFIAPEKVVSKYYLYPKTGSVLIATGTTLESLEKAVHEGLRAASRQKGSSSTVKVVGVEYSPYRGKIQLFLEGNAKVLSGYVEELLDRYNKDVKSRNSELVMDRDKAVKTIEDQYAQLLKEQQERYKSALFKVTDAMDGIGASKETNTPLGLDTFLEICLGRYNVNQFGFAKNSSHYTEQSGRNASVSVYSKKMCAAYQEAQVSIEEMKALVLQKVGKKDAVIKLTEPFPEFDFDQSYKMFDVSRKAKVLLGFAFFVFAFLFSFVGLVLYKSQKGQV